MVIISYVDISVLKEKGMVAWSHGLAQLRESPVSIAQMQVGDPEPHTVTPQCQTKSLCFMRWSPRSGVKGTYSSGWDKTEQVIALCWDTSRSSEEKWMGDKGICSYPPLANRSPARMPVFPPTYCSYVAAFNLVLQGGKNFLF